MGTAPFLSPSKPRPGFPWRKAGGGIALLLVLGAIPGIWWGARYALYGKLALSLGAERAAARREGLPLTPNELRASLPKIAAVDNAAPLYRSLLPTSGKQVGDSVDDWIRRQEKRKAGATPIVAPVPSEVRSCLAALAPRLAIAEKASRLPGCDWNRHWEEGSRVTYPEFSLCRSLVRHLSARALMHAGDGDIAGAFADIQTTARISHHMGADPTLMAPLLQNSGEATAGHTFAQVVLSRPDDPRTIIEARQTVAAFQPLTPRDFMRALDGDAMVYRISLEEYRRDPAAFRRAYASLTTPDKEGNSYATPLPTGPTGLLTAAWEANGIARQRALHAALNQPPSDDPMAQYRAVAEICSCEEALAKRPGHEFASYFFSTVRHTTVRLVEDTARDRLRRTLIALVAARQISGTHNWPTSLPAAPASALAERTDPYTGKPLHYTLTNGGYGFLLYSVGNNGKDEGGSVNKLIVPDGSQGRTDDIAIRFP